MESNIKKYSFKFTIFIYPLNSLYMYNNNYLDRSKHIETFLQTTSNLIKENKQVENQEYNNEINVLLDKKLEIVPYVLKEFLMVMKENKINIQLIAESPEEFDVVKTEIKYLNI